MISCSLECWNVSRVAHRNPLAIIGRLLGGCGICGSLHSESSWHQCLPNSGSLCTSCYHTFIQIDCGNGNGAYWLPDCPDHPYRGTITEFVSHYKPKPSNTGSAGAEARKRCHKLESPAVK